MPPYFFYHVYIALNQTDTFEKAHEFAKNSAQYLAQENSEEMTIE